MSDDGVKDITWLSPTGAEMTEEQWRDGNARCAGLMLNGRAVSDERKSENATLLLVLFNGHTEPVPFTLPLLSFGGGWQKILDTVEEELAEPTSAGEQLDLRGRSLTLLVRTP